MVAQRQRSDKLLERMKNNPRGDWKLSDVETLAKRYGFSMEGHRMDRDLNGARGIFIKTVSRALAVRPST